MAAERMLPDVGQGRQLLPLQLPFGFLLSARLFDNMLLTAGHCGRRVTGT